MSNGFIRNLDKEGEAIYMKWIGMLAMLFVLYGCTEQKEVQTEMDLPTVEVNIPPEVARHYGSLNIEDKATEVQKTIQPDGVVSLKMNEKQLSEIAQQTQQFLEEYKEVSGKSSGDWVTRITSNDTYTEWEIILSNDSILQQEAFELAQEHLIKNILTYQLTNRYQPELRIRYLLNSGEQLEVKVIRTEFAYSDE